jgi:recombination protein RecA
MRLGDTEGGQKVETTPSGSIALDLALGGGYARGRVIEIY